MNASTSLPNSESTEALPSDLSSDLSSVPVPFPYQDGPAELTESGTWGETQVIDQLKDAHSRNKCPQRALQGKVTMRLGDIAGGPMLGQLVLTKRRKRTRIRRFLSYLSS